MPTFDPAASLRIWAVEVDLAGFTLRIPPLPASDWLPILMRLEVLGLMELIEDVDLDEPLMDGTLKADQVVKALEELTEAATGRTQWCTMMLALSAREHWHVVGADLARAGVRFDQISIGAALDAIYGSLCRSMDEKGIAKFNRALEHPPVDTVQPREIRPPRGAKPLPASAEQYVRVRPKTVLRRPQDRQPAPSATPIGPPVPPAHSDPPASGATPTGDRPPPG